MKPQKSRELVTNHSSEETYIGSRTSLLGVEENISISDDQRVKHLLTTGATGAGKSQELLHAALQDAYRGFGFAVINSKGKLLDEFLSKMPEHRYKDLIYVNPVNQPITGINVLEPYVNQESPVAVKANQIELIVSNLIQLFKKRSVNWGDRFGRVLATLLRAGIEANIEYNTGYTLLDIKRCVTCTEDLKDLIDNTRDPEIRSQLVNIKNNLSDSQLEPLVRRLNDFTENKTVRHVIAAENSDINFKDVVNRRKILLVDSREGEVGTTVLELLTSIVVTKLWAAAQKRYYQDQVNSPFYLFIDELQTFPTEGSHFAEILSKAREYSLGCWLTTQYLSRLPRQTRNAVKNNCRTKLVFAPSGSEDLSKIARMLRGTNQDRLTRLKDYQAVVQKPENQQRSTAITIDTYPPWSSDQDQVEEIKSQQSVATRSNQGGGSKLKQSLGQGNNVGGEAHEQLLINAKKRLEQDRDGVQVNLLYQDTGDDKPDGKVILSDGDIAHLEAEHSTLTKPVKVLTNYLRATQEQRECIFVVEQGKAAKLQNILEDPVNRRGNEHEDQDGSYSYYTGEDGDFTETETLQNGEYRIIEIQEDTIEIHKDTVEVECPELETQAEEDLEGFCLYREEDGHCTALGQQCTLIQADD